jgi:RNA polymerase sigma factor (TIGR02999 family)
MDDTRHLTEELYLELRRLAESQMRHQPSTHTLQATALVHEAFVRLAVEDGWVDQDHFLAAAARTIRHVLIDHERRRRAQKRDRPGQRVPLESVDDAGKEPANSIDLLALDESLERLRERNERQARLVELRFFGGLAMEDAARILGVSDRTVFNDWSIAKAFLHSRLAATAHRQ